MFNHISYWGASDFTRQNLSLNSKKFSSSNPNWWINQRSPQKFLNWMRRSEVANTWFSSPTDPKVFFLLLSGIPIILRTMAHDKTLNQVLCLLYGIRAHFYPETQRSHTLSSIKTERRSLRPIVGIFKIIEGYVLERDFNARKVRHQEVKHAVLLMSLLFLAKNARHVHKGKYKQLVTVDMLGYIWLKNRKFSFQCYSLTNICLSRERITYLWHTMKAFWCDIRATLTRPKSNLKLKRNT